MHDDNRNFLHRLYPLGLMLFILCQILLAQKSNNPLIGQIHFADAFKYPSAALQKAAGISSGTPLNRKDLPQFSRKIETYLYEQGYLFARIDSVQVQPVGDSSRVNLHFYGARGEQVSIGQIYIKSDSIKTQEYKNRISLQRGQPFSAAQTDQAIRQFLQTASYAGYLFADASVGDLKIQQKDGKSLADLYFQIHEHKRVYIKNILITGNTYTKQQVILRELAIQPGQLYSNRLMEEIPRRLMRLAIFKTVKPPEIYRIAPDSIYLKIEIEEGNATTFDGVVGYIPESANNGSGYFTGLVDISFKNLFGSGRKFAVHWKKPDKLSEEFLVAYTEPWVLNYPLDVGVHLERMVRDTTFIQWNYGMNLRMRLFKDLSLIAKIQKDMYIPDSAASHDLRLLKNEITNLQAGMEYDTRDYPLNPRNGIYYFSSYTLGLKQNIGPEYVIKEDSLKKREDLHSIQLKLEFYYNLWANQVFAVNVNANQVKGNQLQLTDYHWFGGSRSLRGYRENQFRGSLVAWTNLEYRFLMGRNARLFLFSDWGFYSYEDKSGKMEELMPGYGMGVRFETPLGVMGVDFGLGKGDSFREAKIHFGLVNQF